MFKDIYRRLQCKDGFGLIESVIALAIIAILAVVAMPAFSSYRDRTHLAALFKMGNSVRSALTSLAADDRDSLYPASVTLDMLNAGGASLPASGYTLTYEQTGTPAGSSYTLLLKHSATGNQVCVTPMRTQKAAAGVCS